MRCPADQGFEIWKTERWAVHFPGRPLGWVQKKKGACALLSPRRCCVGAGQGRGASLVSQFPTPIWPPDAASQVGGRVLGGVGLHDPSAELRGAKTRAPGQRQAGTPLALLRTQLSLELFHPLLRRRSSRSARAAQVHGQPEQLRFTVSQNSSGSVRAEWGDTGIRPPLPPEALEDIGPCAVEKPSPASESPSAHWAQ